MVITANRIDSDLGCWAHHEWRPPADHPLSRVTERIWHFDGRVADRRERVFPTAALELIVQLDDRYHDVEGDRLRLTPVTCVTGIQMAPMVIEAPSSRCHVLGIRFHPVGAWVVLQHPLFELTGRTVDLDDLMGATARELASRCEDARDAEQRIQRAVPWVCDRLALPRRTPCIDPAVEWVAVRIDRARGDVRISEMRNATGLRANQLTARFLQQIGVTPKRLARIHRFRRALDMLRAAPARLSDVALDAGFYDQAHMTVEFRELAGLTPSQFVAAKRYPASTSTAEA